MALLFTMMGFDLGLRTPSVIGNKRLFQPSLVNLRWEVKKCCVLSVWHLPLLVFLFMGRFPLMLHADASKATFNSWLNWW